MDLQTIIFIGRSGCGKGTQVSLLKDLLKSKDSDREILHLETGIKFREFMLGDKYSHKLSNEIYKRGERQPDFLAISFWADFLVENLKDNEHLFCDGICRSLPEAMIFTTAVNFYNRKVTVIHINVSREWSRDRLLARGRGDDDRLGIEKRLDWFEKDTNQSVEYFKSNSQYSFLEINGEQSIDDVHKEILQKIGWQ